MLKLNGYQATFLPQVWEEIEDFELFIQLSMPRRLV